MEKVSIPGQIRKLSTLYAQKILVQKTREVSLLGKKCKPTIIYTFLGFELQANSKRITCPDMSTARYLKIFSELGMPSIRIPYDPTQTSLYLTKMENYLEKIKELLLEEKLTKSKHQRKLRRIYGKIRDHLHQAEQNIVSM